MAPRRRRPRLRRDAALGLRRVNWVRITVGDKGPVYEVAGIGHRRPVTRRIGASTAAALVAGGVPLIRHALPSTGARAKADQGPADAVLED